MTSDCPSLRQAVCVGLDAATTCTNKHFKQGKGGRFVKKQREPRATFPMDQVVPLRMLPFLSELSMSGSCDITLRLPSVHKRLVPMTSAAKQCFSKQRSNNYMQQWRSSNRLIQPSSNRNCNWLEQNCLRGRSLRWKETMN